MQHVNISACDVILKPCLYSRICLILTVCKNFSESDCDIAGDFKEKSLIAGAGINERQRLNPVMKSMGTSGQILLLVGCDIHGY